MNGIEKITARIEADTQAEIDRVLAEAQTQAAEIRKKYAAEAAAESEALAAANQREADEREERLVRMAQMEARKVTLAARQELVEQAYIRALEKLCGLPQAQSVELLAKLLRQAAPDGRGEVIFSQKDRARLGAAAVERANANGGSLRLSEETRPMEGGFIVRNGKVELNCTFETLVRLQKAETAGAVVKTLFPA